MKRKPGRKTCKADSDQIPSKIGLQLEYYFDTVMKKPPSFSNTLGERFSDIYAQEGFKKEKETVCRASVRGGVRNPLRTAGGLLSELLQKAIKRR